MKPKQKELLENTWNDSQSVHDPTWMNLHKLEDKILVESLNEAQSNGTNENKDEDIEKVKTGRKNKTGRRINRPTEYNYPQKCEFCGQIFLEKEMVRHKKVHPESFTLDCIPCGKFFNSKAAYDTHYNIHKIYHCVSCKKDFNARKHYRSHMERIHKSEGERPRIHECDICQKTFKDKFVLNTHKKTHFNIKAHKCPMCDYACNNLTYMRQHVMNHTNQLQFKCHICYRGFTTDADLQVHIDKLHSNEPQVYSCDVCGKISTSKGNLRQHQKIHNPEHNLKKDHQCFECGKTFALKCRLKKHILSHKGQDKCHCSVCGKLLSKDSYKKHLKAHSGEKPFLCDYCGEAFTTNSCLMGHRRTHTGEKPVKPFSCEHCGKSFAQQSVFLSHKKTHTSSTVKGFFCEDCGKSFAQASLLASHKKVHTVNNSYTCELCGKGFPDHSQLLDHRNNYHVPERSYSFIGFTSQQGLQEAKDAKMFGQWSKPHTSETKKKANQCLECSLCGKKFTEAKNINRHMKRAHGTRPHACHNCPKSFFYAYQLKLHSLVHMKNTTKKFSCPDCTYQTNYKQYFKIHRRKHTSEFRYVCSRCPQGFTDRTSLENHQMKAHGDTWHACSKCRKSYSTCRFKAHLRSHSTTKDQRFFCEFCGKGFQRKCDLKIHKNIHTREFSFSCSVCRKSLSSKSRLMEHQKIHSGKKDFMCEICGKTFLTAQYLKIHSFTHAEVKPFKCEFCGKCFTQKTSLTLHRRCHTGERPFGCDVCLKRFVTRTALSVHLKVHL